MTAPVAMARRTALWLLQRGYLPPVGKADPVAQDVEERLRRRLTELQAGVQAEIIRRLREKGRLPSSPAAREALVREVLGEAMATMPQEIAEAAQQAAEAGRTATLANLQAAGMAVSFDALQEQVAQDLREKTYTFAQSTLDAIVGDVAQNLADSYTDGLGIDDAATRLRQEMSGLRNHRLATIARTEIQGAQNRASRDTLDEHNVEYRQWLTVGDDRVRSWADGDRYDHVHMHGQVIAAGEQYSNGLAYPGDSSGALGQFINCRCREVPYFPGPGENIITTPYYP